MRFIMVLLLLAVLLMFLIESLCCLLGRLLLEWLKLLTEEETISTVIAFPMNSKAQDLLMGAPGEVTEKQLSEVHIKLDLK